MHGKPLAGVLAAALLLLASASPAVGAYSGKGGVSDAAAGARASAHVPTASTLTRRLEDEVEPELSWADNLLGGNGVSYDTLDRNGPACPRHDSCAGKKPGEAYTRPCNYREKCAPH
ncbi:hypothetical protein CFC21_026943 [Triticum aestivum]|uniref:Uncharacterized protein n=2 Tax=Triticum aestivum TaxID=4565 RepID=A0A9R1JDE9_WHEAT|nr:hypothetical protein CFC21_026943 [Triticum aestivum]